MSISFNEIPSGIRVPFSYIEFDSSKAQQGSAIKVYKALILAQKRSAGTATADVAVTVTSEAQALTLFGRGSFAHLACKKYFANNKYTGLTVIPQADNGAGVIASGTLTVTGPATAAGTLSLYIAGQLVEIAVASGDVQNDIATAINAAINLVLDLPVTSTVATNVVTVSCRHKGLLGNDIDMRFNYLDEQAFPTGVSVAIVAMASGTTAPSLTASISAMGEVQYDVVMTGYNDATSLTALEAEMLDRWGPVRQNDGIVVTAKSDTHANLITFGDGRNSKHVVCFGLYKYLEMPLEVACAAGAIIAFYGQQDPARPFQTLALSGIKSPASDVLFTLSERNLLLMDGIATIKESASGGVQLERAITMYQVNGASAADTAYLDANTLLTLSYIRYDWRVSMLNKYPRSKLAGDDARFGAGQKIITPKIGKSEAVAKFREWEELGLVEGFDQFKRDLIVERNASDPNRLDFLMSPDLVNSLTVLGTQIGFLL